MDKINVLTVAADLARRLAHGCAPERTQFANLSELEAAMQVAADADNAMTPECLRWAAAWRREGSVLVHQTTTGRMAIEVGENHLTVGLYSPSYESGDTPYFFVHVMGGEIVAANFASDEARSLVVRKLDRMANVWRYVAPALGLQHFLEACDGDIASIISDSAVAGISEEIAYRGPSDYRIPNLKEGLAYYQSWHWQNARLATNVASFV